MCPRRFLLYLWPFRAPARVTFYASGGPISSNSGCKGYFAPRRDPLLLPAAKVGKNAVQTCGLKIRPRPAHYPARWCIPHECKTSQTTRNVEPTHFSERCRFYSEMQGAASYRFGRLSNRALAAAGVKCRCGPLGRGAFVCSVGRRVSPRLPLVTFVGWCALTLPPVLVHSPGHAPRRGRRPRRPA